MNPKLQYYRGHERRVRDPLKNPIQGIKYLGESGLIEESPALVELSRKHQSRAIQCAIGDRHPISGHDDLIRRSR